MPFTLRQFEQEDAFCQYISLDAFQQVIPLAQVEAVLATHGPAGTRVRHLTPKAIVWLVIVMHLFSRSSLAHVFQHLVKGLRFVWPNPLYQLPGDAALSYRRYQLGAKPLVALFHAICRPMATLETKGAFLFDLRLMAIDGTVSRCGRYPRECTGIWSASRGARKDGISAAQRGLPG